MKDIETIATDIVDCAIKVHRTLGPGLLESAYQKCLTYELRKRGRDVKTEVKLPVIYEDQKIDVGYRIDTWVDELIVIENKAVETLLPIHQAQLLTYLKLSGCKIGFLLNWNVRLMKNGIRRVVFGLDGQTPYPRK
ncbi:MAG TPA: GxxExxY protein [Anaerolineales bacterium]|nr:GxxExxY protein [Anaerolineales bacterium]